MADIIAEMQTQTDQVQVGTRKPRKGRKALVEKNSSTDPSIAVPVKAAEFSKALVENQETVSHPHSSPNKKAASKKSSKQSFEKELQELQDMLLQLRLEKDKAEELLKAKDEILKQKEQELETRDRKQEKLQLQLKKLQKWEEFNPTVNFNLLMDKELDNKDQKKKKKKSKNNGCVEIKRPTPPYALWCKDQWNEIKKENPEADFKEISSILGTKWKTVCAEEKRPYEEKYQTEKEVYLRVMAKERRESEAMKLLEEEHKQKTAMELLQQFMHFKQKAEKESKRNKKEKDPLKPKQPVSAFFLFINERRAALLAESKSVLEISKVTSEEWKKMTEEQRKPYEEMAKKNKEKYVQDMMAYKQKKDEEAASLKKEENEQMKLQKQEAMQLLKKKEKTENLIKKSKEALQKSKKSKEDKKNADPNKPKKPASSFLMFSKEIRKSLLEERSTIGNSTMNALVSVKWKELSEEERQVWNDKAAEAMEIYKKDLEEYNKFVAAALDEKTEE